MAKDYQAITAKACVSMCDPLVQWFMLQAGRCIWRLAIDIGLPDVVWKQGPSDNALVYQISVQFTDKEGINWWDNHLTHAEVQHVTGMHYKPGRRLYSNALNKQSMF